MTEMKLMKVFKVLSLFLLFVSCAVHKYKVSIESNPGKADLYLYSEVQRKFIKIGQTPFELESKDIKKYLKPTSDFAAFRVEKKGHAVENILYDLKTKKRFNYLLELKKIEIWSDSEAELSSKLANNIAKRVQIINSHILKKDLNSALSLTNKLVDQYPKAYIFYDIKGSIYLLKGQKKLALGSLKKSLSINPDNIQAEKIVKVLEEKN